MTSRERLKLLLAGELPDRVPCCPDISNMVPAKLTGKPFWDIYAFQNPPIWKAYSDAVKHFGIDGGFESFRYMPFVYESGKNQEERIVKKLDDGSFVTRKYNHETSQWASSTVYYTADNPPATEVSPDKFGLPENGEHDSEPLTGVKQWPKGLELWKLVRKEMGDHGILGLSSDMTTCMLRNEENVYSYFDDPSIWKEKSHNMMQKMKKRMEWIDALPEELKPDFVFCGGSGSLVLQTPDMFREIVLPVLKCCSEIAYDMGIPSHVHCCGPAKELVKMALEETMLTIIDPLELAPMGDCDLAEIKEMCNRRLILKGNLHTTDVMLKGSVEDVRKASRAAIEAGGPRDFILSTGDQCGRDTPYDNIFAMVEIAKEYKF